MAFCYQHEFCLAVLLLGSASILGQETGCNASVTEGGTANLTFHFRNDLNTSSDSFYAYLRRNKDQESDILRCFRSDDATDVHCTATTPQYKAGELVNHSLNMLIPNVTHDFEDTYVLRVYVNDSPESPISCTLTVKAKKSEERGQDKLLLVVFSAVGISVPLIIVVAVVILCWRRRRKRPGTKTRYSYPRVEEGCIKIHTPTSFLSNEKGPETSDDMALLSNTATQNNTDTSTRIDNNMDTVRFGISTEEKPTASFHDDLKRQPWYSGGTTNEQAQLLLATDKNGNGSFLVTDSRIPNEYRLKAKFNGQIKTCSIRPSGKGFSIDKGLIFDSVPELIEYYKTHNTSSLPAVLSTPCAR